MTRKSSPPVEVRDAGDNALVVTGAAWICRRNKIYWRDRCYLDLPAPSAKPVRSALRERKAREIRYRLFLFLWAF